MTALVNEAGSRMIVPQATPLVIADYYDDKVAYLLSLKDFSVLKQTELSKEMSVAGFGVVLPLAVGTDRKIAAIYSSWKWVEGNMSGPSFATECWFLFGDSSVDLNNTTIQTSWTNGWLTRTFAVLKGEATLWRIDYRRPWLHELLRGSRESDLHGPDDFFCYVDWLSRTVCHKSG